MAYLGAELSLAHQNYAILGLPQVCQAPFQGKYSYILLPY